jgi:hypothetical protein
MKQHKNNGYKLQQALDTLKNPNIKGPDFKILLESANDHGIHIIEDNSFFTDGAFNVLEKKITLNPKLIAKKKKNLVEVLLHELTHAYDHTVMEKVSRYLPYMPMYETAIIVVIHEARAWSVSHMFSMNNPDLVKEEISMYNAYTIRECIKKNSLLNPTKVMFYSFAKEIYAQELKYYLRKFEKITADDHAQVIGLYIDKFDSVEAGMKDAKESYSKEIIYDAILKLDTCPLTGIKYYRTHGMPLSDLLASFHQENMLHRIGISSSDDYIDMSKVKSDSEIKFNNLFSEAWIKATRKRALLTVTSNNVR